MEQFDDPQEYLNALARFISIGAYAMHGDNLYAICKELARGMDMGYQITWPSSLAAATWLNFCLFHFRKPGLA